MTMKKSTLGVRFDHERYGMILCPDCKGSGKSFHYAKGVTINVCKVCGGFGLIKKKVTN